MGITINISTWLKLLYFNLLSFRGGVIFRICGCIYLKSAFDYQKMAESVNLCPMLYF